MLVPTRNEAANIEELLRRVSAAVTGILTEIVFVDDSDDDTPTVIRTVAHRRGIGAPWACVLDGDLQAPTGGHPRPAGRGGAGRGRPGDRQPVPRRGGADGLGPVRALVSTACGSAAKLLFPCASATSPIR